MQLKAPIPTEYRGVRFDSKSEAVFARLLDLSEVEWDLFHPIEHDGHSWDFLIWIKRHRIFNACAGGYTADGKPIGEQMAYWGSGGYVLKPVLVELKPSRPTVTYIANLTRRTAITTPSGHEFDRLLVWGNPFGEQLDFYDMKTWYLCKWLNSCSGCDAFGCNAESELVEQSIGVKSYKAIEAKSYRFDLGSTNGQD